MFTQKNTLVFIFFCTLFTHSFAIKSLEGIQVGGIYQMELLNGDLLEGVIEDKSDSTIIIECKGVPYTFKGSLIYKFNLITPPQIKSAKSKGSRVLSFDEVLHRPMGIGKIKVQISNGAIFKGRITGIDAEYLKINVDGSIIPISKDIITSITTLIPRVTPQETIAANKEKKYTGPFDTVYVQNSEKDEYGRPLENLIIVGRIESDDSKGMSIKTPDGKVLNFPRNKIKQIIRNTEVTFDQKIKKYAKSLFCYENMILVDLPPGTEGRPFFKVCIDKYEYPNKRNIEPANNVSFQDAKKFCKDKGKRLCTTDEWKWACSGLEEYTYPYGYRLEKEYCNREGAQNIEMSGARNRCVGKFGVYDMVGNIFEWVIDKNNKPMLMGGPYSKCQAISPGMSGQAKPSVGLRCCKSN